MGRNFVEGEKRFLVPSLSSVPEAAETVGVYKSLRSAVCEFVRIGNPGVDTGADVDREPFDGVKVATPFIAEDGSRFSRDRAITEHSGC